MTMQNDNNAISCSTVPEGLQFTVHLPAHGHAGKQASCPNRVGIPTHPRAVAPDWATQYICPLPLPLASLMSVEATSSRNKRPPGPAAQLLNDALVVEVEMAPVAPVNAHTDRRQTSTRPAAGQSGVRGKSRILEDCLGPRRATRAKHTTCPRCIDEGSGLPEDACGLAPLGQLYSCIFQYCTVPILHRSYTKVPA